MLFSMHFTRFIYKIHVRFDVQNVYAIDAQDVCAI